MNIGDLVMRQRAYFMSGATRPLSFRMDALKKLCKALTENETLINDALMKDLGKSPFETYITETGMVLEELRFHIRRLPRWMKNWPSPSPVAQFHAKSFVSPEPYGVALIMAPWNYPLQLSLLPLVGAISAGNCAILKPSAYAPATSRAIAKLVGGIYPSEYVAVVEGGREENKALLEEEFDYIFFTGSVAVGKEVMAAAAKHLTPVTLELGGKSPVIVDETADIRLAARRIAFGKVLNAGQTCVAPDYLLVHENVKDSFIEAYAAALKGFFPDGKLTDYPHIVNEKHFARLLKLMENEKAVLGGGYDAAARTIEPALLWGVTPDSPIMQEEIFGPILPLMTYHRLEECVDFIRSRPKPLALYLFTSDRRVEEKILDTCSFGGGCVNDTVIHVASSRLGFGGVGASGMGRYHGKSSFDTFSHDRSIVRKSTWIDIPLRYHPYRESALKIIKRIMR